MPTGNAQGVACYAIMKLFQRPGRSGWYINVPVPKHLRATLKKGSVFKKAGNTYKEACRNAPQLELFIMQGWEEQDTPLASAESIYGDLSKVTEQESDDIQHAFLADPRITEKEARAIGSALKGRDTWQDWIRKRIKHEDPAGSTITGWNSYLNLLAQWYGDDYLHGLTEEDAVRYKEHLLERMERSSARKVISCHKGFWNWAKAHKQLKVNIWEGLTRRLDSTKKKPLPDESVIDLATRKAIEKRDYRYLIMRFTGCRSNESNGLRHCDIDLDKRTITFCEWSKDGMERRLKGREKDERTIPICSQLFESLKSIELDGSDNPIWSSAYKAKQRTWGAHWTSDFRSKYVFVSHDLRRNAVTKLSLAGVSPFIIHAITKQKVPGMSEVIATYTRPTTEQLREAMELL